MPDVSGVVRSKQSMPSKAWSTSAAAAADLAGASEMIVVTGVLVSANKAGSVAISDTAGQTFTIALNAAGIVAMPLPHPTVYNGLTVTPTTWIADEYTCTVIYSEAH